jgi:hypothetical protein
MPSERVDASFNRLLKDADILRERGLPRAKSPSSSRCRLITTTVDEGRHPPPTTRPEVR